MTFILGTSQLSYDHFGTWVDVIEAHAEAPDAILGDASNPGSARPGTFALTRGRRSVAVTITAD